MPDDGITIKLLSENDATVLDSVDEDVFDNPIRADSVQSFLSDPNSHIAVALNEGTVVGMASAIAYSHPDKPLQLFINEVGVAEQFLRRGLGKKLVRTLLQKGAELGCAEAWVATEEENLPARALYKALGGHEDASRAVVYTYALQSAEEEY
jgi:ribosomal protein S18 acetylase RimI-like enzyme